MTSSRDVPGYKLADELREFVAGISASSPETLMDAERGTESSKANSFGNCQALAGIPSALKNGLRQPCRLRAGEQIPGHRLVPTAEPRQPSLLE